jgi:amidase
MQHLNGLLPPASKEQYMSDSLCFLPATEQLRFLFQREVSAVELLQAHLTRIDQVNPIVNAIVTQDRDGALRQAGKVDAAIAAGVPIPPLSGLPIVHKDLFETAGMRTTYGSPIFADYVPDFDALIVERTRAAGAVSLGKSNTPEFGAGSQTFNQVFGATRNPYNPTLTCGGSSGGAAVALATGMAALADGSDLGGSLRNPAAFCNVVGFRTTAGRVPIWPDTTPYMPLGIDGPMARTVGDIALMLDVVSGFDARAPLSFDDGGPQFSRVLDTLPASMRVAWSVDLGGLPVDNRIRDVLAPTRSVLSGIGCRVDDAWPDMHEADEIFQVLRAFRFELGLGGLLDREEARLKDTVVWNIRAGRALSGPQVGRATRMHAALRARMADFMREYDFLVTTVTQVPPFPVEQPYVTEINGVQLNNYLEWMRSCYYISACGLPAISVPAGFTADGLPVGLQIIGRPRAEREVLQLAYAFEQATGYWRRQPAIV